MSKEAAIYDQRLYKSFLEILARIVLEIELNNFLVKRIKSKNFAKKKENRTFHEGRFFGRGYN